MRSSRGSRKRRRCPSPRMPHLRDTRASEEGARGCILEAPRGDFRAEDATPTTTDLSLPASEEGRGERSNGVRTIIMPAELGDCQEQRQAGREGVCPMRRRQPGQLRHAFYRGYSERQKICGVFVTGKVMNVFMVPQILGTGSNLVCTAMYHQLMELADEWNKPIGDLVLQLENTVAENKNNILTGMSAALVDAGVARTITLVFMMVGHTHNEIDQVFSCFSRGVKGRNVFTRRQLGRVFADSYTATPVRTRTFNMGNFKDLLALLVRRTHGKTRFQSYRISKDGSYITVVVKYKMHRDNWLVFSDEGREVVSGEGYKPLRILRSGAVRFENTPAYPLKEVDPEIIRQIGIRQKASWPRVVAASFPGDSEKLQEVKEEHGDSLRILRMKGSRPFDLRTDWLQKHAGDSVERRRDGVRDNDDDDPDQDSGSGRGGESQGDDEFGDSDDDIFFDYTDNGGSRGRHGFVRGGEVGRFAFFVTEGAHFLVGKGIETRDAPSEDGGKEVYLHYWFIPTRTLVDNAGETPFDDYAKATFNAAYRVVQTGNNRSSRRPQYNADTSWESAGSIVATCCALIGNGKNIPASVKEVLRNQRSRVGERHGGGANSSARHAAAHRAARRTGQRDRQAEAERARGVDEKARETSKTGVRRRRRKRRKKMVHRQDTSSESGGQQRGEETMGGRGSEVEREGSGNQEITPGVAGCRRRDDADDEQAVDLYHGTAVAISSNNKRGRPRGGQMGRQQRNEAGQGAGQGAEGAESRQTPKATRVSCRGLQPRRQWEANSPA